VLWLVANVQASSLEWSVRSRWPYLVVFRVYLHCSVALEVGLGKDGDGQSPQ
jgi:hypothetical protein